MTHCPGNPNFKSRGQAIAAWLFLSGLVCLYIGAAVYMSTHGYPPAFSRAGG